MNFTKAEKKFWQTHFHFDKPSQLHDDWLQYWSVDGEEDDEFFYFFTLRVPTITEVHLKETLITDKAVGFMRKFTELKSLYLRKHPKITSGSISHINEMNCLEMLNVTKTQITLTDLFENLNNPNLKQVFVSMEGEDINLEEKAIVLKLRMPKCDIFLNCSSDTDVFGNPEKPIF